MREVAFPCGEPELFREHLAQSFHLVSIQMCAVCGTDLRCFLPRETLVFLGLGLMGDLLASGRGGEAFCNLS